MTTIGRVLAFVGCVSSLTACSAQESVPMPASDCLERVLEPSLFLVQRMQDDGFALSKPRVVTHLFFGSAAEIDSAAKQFSGQRYDILERAKGRLLVGHTTAIPAGWVRKMMPEMCSVGQQFSLRYDGWDIDVAAEKHKSKADQ